MKVHRGFKIDFKNFCEKKSFLCHHFFSQIVRYKILPLGKITWRSTNIKMLASIKIMAAKLITKKIYIYNHRFSWNLFIKLWRVNRIITILWFLSLDSWQAAIKKCFVIQLLYLRNKNWTFFDRYSKNIFNTTEKEICLWVFICVCLSPSTVQASASWNNVGSINQL